MAVGVEDQLPAVRVALPLRDHLHVDSFFECAGDEHASESSLAVGRKVQASARSRKRFLGVLRC